MLGQQNIKFLIGLLGGYVVRLVNTVTNVHRKRPRRHHAHARTHTHELPRATGTRVIHKLKSNYGLVGQATI